MDSPSQTNTSSDRKANPPIEGRPETRRDSQDVLVERISEFEWEIPKSAFPGMRIESRLIASEALLANMKKDRTLRQLSNIAHLPGLVAPPKAMPDAHEGYGFPIGGVAALDFETGGISPGGIGYDINCGVRLIRTNLAISQVIPKVKDLLSALDKRVPSGVGRGSKRKLSPKQVDETLEEGLNSSALSQETLQGDFESCEENGRMEGARADKVSDDAKKRGKDQLGTLGAGNHFLEIQRVAEILDESSAKAFSLEKDQAVIMVHTGSRGLGHQTCSDYLRAIEDKFKAELSALPDRELAYAPAGSKECESYFSAMAGAVNFAFANRQEITNGIRGAFSEVFRKDPESLGMTLLYDVCHNIAKIEEHSGRKCYLHRKGATRAFGPGRKEVPKIYRSVGQPVILPGSMGTGSYVLAGKATSHEKSFGSTAHGAGRVMSRGEALRRNRGEDVARTLEGRGIIVKSASWRSIAEEAPESYKDVNEVARVSNGIGIAGTVARLVPVGVLKG